MCEGSGVIEAVLFDLDGLIVDTEPIHFLAFRRFMQKHSVELPESLMAKLVGYNEWHNIRMLKDEYGLTPPVEEMVLERRALYAYLLETEPLPVFPGFWELTAEARRLGLRQAVVSSSGRAQVLAPLRRLFAEQAEEGDPERYFDAIVSGDDASNAKPAPDLYLCACARLGLPAEACVAFEDTPAGVSAAAAAGVAVYAVPNVYTRGAEFVGATAVLGSLAEGRDLLMADQRGEMQSRVLHH